MTGAELFARPVHRSGWPGDPAALYRARDRRLIAPKQALRRIGAMAELERDLWASPTT